MKVVEETFCQLLQKVLCLWRKQIFVYTDKDCAINLIRPKFLSLLMTVKIRIGVTEKGSLKKYLEVVYIPLIKGCMHNIKLLLTYSELTVHLQNQLSAGSFVGTNVRFSHDMHFSLMHML